jgi:hypothetical protein
MILLAKISFQLDSALPRDAVTISPCYNGDDAQALANGLKANLIASVHVGPSVPFKISVYNATKPPPNYPLAVASNGTGSLATTGPRELALCLSYFSVANRPSQRGRLFIPWAFLQGAVGLRPTSGQITAALDFGTVLGKSLPANHTWAVHSRKHDTTSAAVITDIWVDDEWDVIRSRGLKSTTRQTGKIP